MSPLDFDQLEYTVMCDNVPKKCVQILKFHKLEDELNFDENALFSKTNYTTKLLIDQSMKLRNANENNHSSKKRKFTWHEFWNKLCLR